MTLPTRQNLYRKYRPQTFSELLGQDHVVRTLQAAVSQGRMSHAYLFSGPRGTGKTSAARLLAKTINCLETVRGTGGFADPCRTCSVCTRIEEQTFLDIIEIDAASNNGVEDIRDMREKVKYIPVEGKFKVYIIDEVHMLSGAAFNAFLKTLEEPPPRVIFILATTDPQKVPATILSRCQCFDFHSVGIKVMVERLRQVAQLERDADPECFPAVTDDALFAIAEAVDGGFRDALSLLDQLTSAGIGHEVGVEEVLMLTRRVGFQVLKNLAVAVFSKKPAAVLAELNDLYLRGYDVHSIGRDFLEFLRRCMVFRIDEKAHQVIQMPAEQARELSTMVSALALELILAMISELERVLSHLRNSVNPKLLFEVELVRLAQRETSVGLEGLTRRVEQLEVGGKSRFAPARPTGSPTVAGSAGVVPRSGPPSGPTSVVRERPRETPVAMSSPPMSSPLHTPIPGIAGIPLKDRLPAFRKALGAINPIMGSCFQSAVIETDPGGEVTILLASDFSARQVNDPKNAVVISGVAETVFGREHKVVFRSQQAKSEGQGVSSPVPGKLKEHMVGIEREERRKTLEKPEVKEALSIFGGEVIAVEKLHSQETDK
jgi:DNA polymerase-3 subunit gamma/tau